MTCTISNSTPEFTTEAQQSKEIASRVPEILCMDDDPEVSRNIEIRLRDFRVNVTRAFFGMQGFWEATTSYPDLIIMDLAMPNGDGRFVLESLKGNTCAAAIPVIVLTGMRDRRLRHELLSLGADCFLNKPVRFEELQKAISRFVTLERRLETLDP